MRELKKIIKIIRETNDDFIEHYKKLNTKTSEENHNALEKEVKKEITWGEIYDKYIQEKNEKVITTNVDGGVKSTFKPDDVDIKMNAIKKFIITAKYLNENWVADWKDVSQSKFYIVYNEYGVFYASANIQSLAPCYFSSHETIQRAIEILGKEVIKTALRDY